MREGKKESVMKVKHDIPENSNSEHCDGCGFELTKLETFIGEPFQEDKKWFYWMYWKVLCDNCGELKVKESKLKTMQFPIVGRYNDRTRLGGY